MFILSNWSLVEGLSVGFRLITLRLFRTLRMPYIFVSYKWNCLPTKNAFLRPFFFCVADGSAFKVYVANPDFLLIDQMRATLVTNSMVCVRSLPSYFSKPLFV